ncbi:MULTISPECIES: 3D domain-containing protein [Paenibacillus]|uniref:LysM peptidoglycan-binding domain-containing protein n=1 Tax=Paenibacillus agri TaxID=2744309 RepID=A0A850ESN9_9BACL|nr:3D domain-containing protein [Paenibacillus agri]NUU62729.1 LysM peptidoglycan-binding domain-containing protein [Paenibacillus agri]
MKINFKMIKTFAALIGISAALQAVPVHADGIHTAKEGNTFYTLSKQYGVSVDALMKANPQVSATNIYSGLKLNIPGKTPTLVAQSESAKAEVITANLNVQPETNTVSAWGKVFNYDRTLQVKASAYSSASSENGKWGAVDYLGNPLKLGTIAVDPSVIPIGTKVLVTGYTHPGLPKSAFVATATDMGSAIKGNRIDIFIPGSPSFVADFGYQYVQLYVIQ